MPQKNRWDHRRLESGLRGLFFLGLFIYLWKGIEPHLLYYGFGVFTAYPTFSLEPSFLHAVFRTCGGPTDALAALLSQSYATAWFGAIVIALVPGIVFLAMRCLLRRMEAERFADLAWALPLLAVMIYQRYENPLAILLGVGLALWTTVLYSGLPVKALPKRAVLFLALFAIVYYLAGAAAFVFAATACLIEALRHRRITLALVQGVLAAGGALILGRFVFGLDLRATYTAGTPWDPNGEVLFSAPARRLVFALYALLPCAIVLLSLAGLLRTFMARSRVGRPKNKPQSTGRSGRIALWARPLAVAVTMVIVLTFSRTAMRYERALNYHAQQRDWDAVIALAHQWPDKSTITRAAVFDINRALAHHGRLGSELCAYRQDGTQALFLSFEDMSGRLRHVKMFELFMDLGGLNDAEKNVYEMLENDGPSPYVLEAMVRVHLAKGQYETARIAFRALQKCVGGHPYARRWQSVIANPAQAQTHALIQSCRAVRPTTDHASTGLSVVTLKRLLQDNPNHRLAFEYLMACYLLKHQRTELVRCLPLLRPLGYAELPRHYAEALLVHSLETRSPVEAWGWPIDQDLRLAFGEIRNVVTQARGDNQAVFDTLAPKYGDTYTFYSMFNVCGLR